MNKTELLQQQARLESINDQLSAELAYVDRLMRMVGFGNGLETLKATAKELITLEEENPEDDKGF
jgi:hypothetical protein